MTEAILPDPVDSVSPSHGDSKASPLLPHIRDWIFESAAFGSVMTIAAFLRLWNLAANGHGNAYYAAAVRSMLVSPRNFFFGAFDPAGFVTVDKPPVAVWAQAASAKLLGYSGFNILLPQALMGVATVGAVYFIVRRSYGVASAVIAGLCLAITPIAVAVDRGNLPDPLLTLLLTVAAGALLHAIDKGSFGGLLACVALVGIAFNVKMLAAFVVLPTFYLAYWLAAQTSWRNRLVHLTAATVVLAAVSLSWSIAVELTPKANRPYIGGSTNNSAISLALGYNGLGRVFGGSGNPGGGLPGPDGGGSSGPGNMSPRLGGPPGMVGGPGGFPGGPRFGAGPGSAGGPPGMGPGGPFGGTPGLFRFGNATMAEQITWLFPLAIFGAIAAAIQAGRPAPLTPAHAAWIVWTGWLTTHWVVFSFARGIFHEYYTIVLGPAVAALVGAGVPALWLLRNAQDGRRALLPSAIVLTICWQASMLGQYEVFRYGLLPAMVMVGFVAVVVLTRSEFIESRFRILPWSNIGASVGLATLLVGPALWSLSSALGKGNGMLPSADISYFAGSSRSRGPMPPFDADPKATAKLVEYLRSKRGGERYFVAGSGSMDVCSIIISSGETAIALGGFMGGDAILTKNQFVEIVDRGELRFVLVGGPGGRGRGSGGGLGMLGQVAGQLMGGPPGSPMAGGSAGAGRGGPPGMPFGAGTSEILAWVREHGKRVDPQLWRVESDRSDGMTPLGPMGGASELYDVKPARQSSRS